MISKFCSSAIHHASKKANNQHSYLSRLNTDCLSKLRKIEINRSTRHQLESLDIEYRYKLHEAVEIEYASVPDHSIFSPDNSPDAEERAKGYQLACALWSAMRFQESYSVSVPGMSLDAAMNPRHRLYLIETFNDTWRTLNADERRRLLTVIQADACQQLGLTLSSEEKKFSQEAVQTSRKQLTAQHVLALVDYCNSQSGNFNPVNDGMRLWQLCCTDKIAEVTECLRTPLNEALHILSSHEDFRYDGPAYKGISLANGAGQFRLFHMQPGRQYTSPHWCSATISEEANYASDKISSNGNSTNDRDTQLTIVRARAVKVHLFNDAGTVHQQEVMLPSKPLLFLSPHDVDQKKFPPNSLHATLYCVAAEGAEQPL